MQRYTDAVSKAEVLETYAELYDIFDDNKYIKQELNKVYDKLNALPEQPEPQWILTSEKMPEKYIGQWLCCTSYGDIMVLPYDTPGDGTKECVFYKWDDDGYFYQTFDVVAWMPLPEPYKEELKLR